MIDTVRPESIGRFVAVVGGGPSSPYPTLSNTAWQALWVNRFKSYTDAGMTTLAGAGDLVHTIQLDPAWGGTSGNIVQTTSGNRPTYQTGGLQCATASVRMPLPALMTLTGDFTVYVAENVTPASQTHWPIAKATAASDGLATCGSGTGTYALGLVTLALWTNSGSAGARILRYRRSGTTSYMDTIGVSETTPNSTNTLSSNTITLGQILARGTGSGDPTSSGARFMQLVVVTANLTPGDADDLAILAALQALEPTVTGP